DFSCCFPENELKARGMVSQVRHILDVKDSFTRMQAERDRERRARLEARQAETDAKQALLNERQAIKRALFALFTEQNPWTRGKALEAVLNRLFQSYGILLREAFTVRGDAGQGVVEQIDGAIELDGELYLVVIKWLDSPLGAQDAAQHLVRIYGRA